MKFSIFLELQISHPTRRQEHQLFHDCVAQAVLADELGYHAVWVVEHHGLFEYSHSSAPEVFLAFVAARTRRIRLGHGVTLTAHRYNHPIRVAERVATLDILSGGRVNWGSGKSSTRTEQDAFGIDRETLDEQWLEALEMIPRMWGPDPFEWEGTHYHIPPIQVVPKPVQRPHPPIFGAASADSTVARLGALGVGVPNFASGTEESLRSRVASYRQAVATARPPGRAVHAHFACTPTAMVLRNDLQACEIGFRGARFFSRSLGTYLTAGDHRPLGALDVPRGALSSAELDAARSARSSPGQPLTSIIGDAVAAREAVSRFAAAGVDELILVMQTGTVAHELVCESMRVFAEEVAGKL